MTYSDIIYYNEIIRVHQLLERYQHDRYLSLRRDTLQHFLAFSQCNNEHLERTYKPLATETYVRDGSVWITDNIALSYAHEHIMTMLDNIQLAVCDIGATPQLQSYDVDTVLASHRQVRQRLQAVTQAIEYRRELHAKQLLGLYYHCVYAQLIPYSEYLAQHGELPRIDTVMTTLTSSYHRNHSIVVEHIAMLREQHGSYLIAWNVTRAPYLDTRFHY